METPILTKSPVRRISQKRLIVISVLVALGGLLFLYDYSGIANHSALASFDLPIAQWMVAHRTGWLTAIMTAITLVISPVGLLSIVLIGAGAWMIRSKEYWRPSLLIGALALSTATFTIIKNLTTRGRPPQADMILPLEVDYSFPSGHTISVAVCLLVLGYLMYSRSRRRRASAIIWAVIALVGTAIMAFSRMYLGYHWFSDVAASASLALVILGIIIMIDAFQSPRKTSLTSKEA
jgi:membrane-associated phospholipid phosphatase